MSFCHKVKFRHCHRNVFKELGYAKDYIYQDGAQLFAFLRYTLITNCQHK